VVEQDEPGGRGGPPGHLGRVELGPRRFVGLQPTAMTEPESPALESITAWHPMLVALLEFFLPGGWQLLPEFLLNRLPLRADIVILRLVGEQASPPRKLHSILDHLRPHTLIEHKGPTDDLEAEDALALLGYAAQYMRLVKVRDPVDLCLMVVCDRIPKTFVEQIERHDGMFAAAGGGLWRGRVARFALHGVETRDACRQDPTERLLYAFSRAYLADPEGILPLDPAGGAGVRSALPAGRTVPEEPGSYGYEGL
jgi:hypothetical protein